MRLEFQVTIDGRMAEPVVVEADADTVVSGPARVTIETINGKPVVTSAPTLTVYVGGKAVEYELVTVRMLEELRGKAARARAALIPAGHTMVSMAEWGQLKGK